MITLYQARTWDNVRMRLIERATRPRFTLIVEGGLSARTVSFKPLKDCHDRDQAVMTFLRAVEQAGAKLEFGAA